ncbi:MAG: hypothetical protein DRP12_00245 [Candidatus Aenigmatarchaeota archaeon]|nr:MAG: hypothetical protein DRP12_00245 [Candidatus Aenigmarchaeota archaeon]
MKKYNHTEDKIRKCQAGIIFLGYSLDGKYYCDFGRYCQYGVKDTIRTDGAEMVIYRCKKYGVQEGI